MTKQHLGLIYILISQICWGLAPKTISLLSPAIPATMVVFIRFMLTSILLFPLIFLRKSTRKAFFALTKKQLISLICLGFLGSGFTDALFVTGVRYTGSILGMVLARLEIPLTVLMAVFLLKEKINKTVIIALCLSFSGVIMISIRNGFSSTYSDQFILGILAALTAALLWAFATIYVKLILNMKIPPIIIVAIRLLVGSISNLVITLATVKDATFRFISISNTDWVKLAFLGIFASALSYYFFYKGLAAVEAQKAAILLSGAMVIALFVGVATGEILTLFQWIGVLSIFSAILIVSRK